LNDPKLKTIYGHKKIFKNKSGDIHVGINAPKDFEIANIEDVKSALKNRGGKKIFRCNVCNDLIIAFVPLEICPTCLQKDAYVEINENEIKNLLEIK
jgi:rubrerythrin